MATNNKKQNSNVANVKKDYCLRKGKDEELNDIITLLRLELDTINKILHKLKIRHTKMSEYANGVVYAKPHNKNYQYFFKAVDDAKEKYIPMTEVPKYTQYAQYEYEAKTISFLLNRKSTIEKFLRKYDASGLNSTYEKLCEGKKRIVVPIEKTDKMRIDDWIKENTGKQNHMPIETDLITDKGELVRSKSEKIIADLLYKNNIPYQYETKLNFSNNIFPDFTVFHVREKRTVYWEHFGLLSSEEYASKNYARIQEYERNGFILGKDLIITMESPEIPLDVKLIQKKIDLFLR